MRGHCCKTVCEGGATRPGLCDPRHCCAVHGKLVAPCRRPKTLRSRVLEPAAFANWLSLSVPPPPPSPLEDQQRSAVRALKRLSGCGTKAKKLPIVRSQGRGARRPQEASSDTRRPREAPEEGGLGEGGGGISLCRPPPPPPCEVGPFHGGGGWGIPPSLPTSPR